MQIPEIIDIIIIKISALQDFVHIPYAQERQNFSQLLTFPGFYIRVITQFYMITLWVEIILLPISFEK